MLATLAVLLVAVLASLPLTRRLGGAAGWPMAAAYLIATATFLPVAREVLAGGTPTSVTRWVPSFDVALRLRADGIGLVFVLIALVIGAVVFAYSARYLGPGRHVSFYAVMALFTLSMVGLVLADDLVLLFICWELTSLASFLLIARSGRAGEHASMRTLLMTYLGGLALLVAVVLIVARTGTTVLSSALTSPVWSDDPGFTALVAVLVAVAGFSKAAQFPFHVWLPDAMAAPTPVSAYLHAAAVVKAGIFLLLRFSAPFHDVIVWQALLITAGLVTALIGARFALEQTDLKRLMAYSTVSQLGLLTAAIGVGTPLALGAAVLHTIAHALFKSGLFMMVGVVDHAAHTRDMRRLPPLWRAMPVSFAVTVVGCASMAGLPPLLGFVSKEGVLAALLESPGQAWVGWLALAAATLASVMTFAYCAKIVLGGFVDGRDDRDLEPAEPPLVLAAALPILVSVPLGFLVGVLDRPVGLAVNAALRAEVPEPHFTLWHGVTPELLATLLIVTVGTIFAVTRRRWWRLLERPTLPFDGPEAIAAIRRGLRRVGLTVTRPTDALRASVHLTPITVAFTVLLLGGTLVVLAGGGVPAQLAGLSRPIDVLVLVLMAAAVFAVARATSRLAAAVSLSAVGVLATVQILALGAPDVGLTQLLIESLTIIVIMLVLQRLPADFGRGGVNRARTASIAVAAGLAAGAGTWLLTGRRPRSDVADYYLANAEPVTGGSNVVNVILVEFRALDTLGELAVLGMAGVAIVAILSTIRSRHLDPERSAARREGARPVLRPSGTTAHRAITEAWPNTVALQLMLRFVTPVLAVLSAMIFLRGHNSPGGGFIAALVGSTIVGMVYLSTSRDRQIGPPRLPLYLIGGGIVTAIGTGLWGLVAAGSFLEPLHGYVGSVHLTTSMLFDVGVYVAVLGLVIITFNLLGVGLDESARGRSEETRERADEAVEGELPGPLETVRGERAARVGLRTSHVSEGTRPEEPGR